MKIKYAIGLKGNREGEFEFLCSTQTHFTSSLKGARKELESFKAGDYGDCDDDEQTYILYKLTMEEVK